MTEGHDGGATLGLGAALPSRGTHRFSHAAMATVFEVRCVHADARYAAQAAQAAFDLVDRLEQELSRFVGNSDISRINHLAAGQRTRVNPSAMECLEIAWHVCHLKGRLLAQGRPVVSQAQPGARNRSARSHAAGN